MLLDFYKKVLESLGMTVSEDGYVYFGSDKVMITAEAKPVVLPTKDHLNSVLATDEDGEIIVTKVPYNPLNENHIKGDTLSLKRTKVFATQQINNSIAAAGELLLTLAENKEFQKKTTLELNKFLGSLNVAQNAGIKKLVDPTSLLNWEKLFANSFKQEKGFSAIYLKKSGIYKGTKYNRLATINFPVYEELLEATPDTPVFGVTLRNKDIKIFRLIFEYLLDLDENNVISIGSNDNESPAFISLFKLYISVMKPIQETIKTLSFVNQLTADTASINISVNIEELDELLKYKQELLTIPSEIDLNRTKVNKQISIDEIQNKRIDAMNKTQTNLPLASNQPKILEPLPLQAPDEQEDPIKKILYGSRVQQQVVAPMVQPMQQAWGFAQTTPVQNYNMMNTNPGNTGFYQNTFNQPIQQNQFTGNMMSMYNPNIPPFDPGITTVPPRSGFVPRF